jgi:hypothetical protein
VPENGNTASEIIAGLGDTLVVRHISSDWVIAIHQPATGLGVVARFDASARVDVDAEIRAALAAIRSPTGAAPLHEIGAPQGAYVIGGATVAADESAARLFKSCRLAIQASLWREGVLLKGEDLGGNRERSLYFDPAAGRFIVRTGAILALTAAPAAGKAAACLAS